ncbi:hypothetical protein AVEN_30209-1, partial [Araneus ventricosus]
MSESWPCALTLFSTPWDRPCLWQTRQSRGLERNRTKVIPGLHRGGGPCQGCRQRGGGAKMPRNQKQGLRVSCPDVSVKVKSGHFEDPDTSPDV